MHIDHQIAVLIGKTLNNEADADEIALLQSFFVQHPESLQQYEVLKKIWPLHAAKAMQEIVNAEIEDSERLNRIKEKAIAARRQANEVQPAAEPATIPKYRVFYRRLLACAAVLILVIGLAYVIVLSNKADRFIEKNKAVVVTAENGSRKRVILPDGSTVLLNAGSRIQYCPAFEGKTRDVTLHGEAFFEVVKNSKSPFHVHCANIDIKVVGTAFNVKSYQDDNTTETTLIRGLVEIIDNADRNAKPIYLHPNEKIILAKNNNGINKRSVLKTEANNKQGHVIQLDSLAKENNWVETAWVYNRLEFRKNTFEDIARKMERWYAVSIIISDSVLARQTFNGSFQTETLDQALTALQKLTPFHYTIQNHTVFINASE